MSSTSNVPQTLRLNVSPAVPGIADVTATLGLRDLAAPDEQMVRDMLMELNISFRDTLYIKRLAHEVENNFAYSTCYWPSVSVHYWFTYEPLRILFVGDRFLKELSTHERLFVLTHEIIHFQKNHPRMNLTFSTVCNQAIPFVALAFGFMTLSFFWHASVTLFGLFCAVQLSLGIYYATFVQLGWVRDFFAAGLSRYNEYYADRHAVHMLGTAVGALAFLQRLHTQGPVAFTWLQALYCTHPSSHARVKKLAKIVFDPVV